MRRTPAILAFAVALLGAATGARAQGTVLEANAGAVKAEAEVPRTQGHSQFAGTGLDVALLLAIPQNEGRVVYVGPYLIGQTLANTQNDADDAESLLDLGAGLRAVFAKRGSKGSLQLGLGAHRASVERTGTTALEQTYAGYGYELAGVWGFETTLTPTVTVGLQGRAFSGGKTKGDDAAEPYPFSLLGLFVGVGLRVGN